MLKAIARRPRISSRTWIALLTAGILGGIQSQGCAGKHRGDRDLPFPMSAERYEADESWSHETPGFITDLNLARDAGAVLVTTRPDYDKPQSPKRFLVTLWNAKGGEKWQQTLPFQVKAQDVARDASLAVVTHYNNEILAFDGSGKRAWSREGNCRPMVLEAVKRVVCSHDDDAEAGTAFEVFDWGGQSIGARQVKQDLLAIKASADERWLAVGLTRGAVELHDLSVPPKGPALEPLWKHTLDGEVLDVAVSNGESPRVAVLYHVHRVGQRVAWFNFAGKAIGRPERPSAHVTQIELTPEGGASVLYGNSPRGQNLIFLEAQADSTPESVTAWSEKWKVADPRFADYATAMTLASDLILIGFEDFAENTRSTRLLGFDREGKVRLAIPLETQQGAYLYAQAYAPSRDALIVGTDDARLTSYRIRRKD